MIKKHFKKIIFVLFVVMALFTITSCNKKKKDVTITGVTLNNETFVYDGEVKNIIAQGIPEGVTASYVIKNSKGEVVTECKNAGTYTVTCTLTGKGYKTLVLEATITINNKTITGLTLSDTTYAYDGEAKTISVVGTLPTGATATYTYKQNNTVVDTCVDAGDYTVTCAVACAGYETLNLNAILTISKIDFVGITLTEKNVDYDGTSKTSAITGTLPTGASVAYEYKNSSGDVVNECILPGTYNVKATVSCKNYNDLVLTSTLTINKVDLSPSAIDKQEKLYTGVAQAYDTTALAADYTVSLLGYYSDEECQTEVAAANVKYGLFYVKLRLGNAIYNDTDVVVQYEIKKTSESYHDVTFTYTYGNEEYVYVLVAAPGTTYDKSVISTLDTNYDKKLPALEEDKEYAFNNYDGDEIYADTDISLIVQTIEYTITFVGLNNETVSTVNLHAHDQFVFPYVVDNDNMAIVTWQYNNETYLTGSGESFDLTTNVTVTALAKANTLTSDGFLMDYSNSVATIISFDNSLDSSEVVTIPKYVFNDRKAYIVNVGAYAFESISTIRQLVFEANVELSVDDSAFARMYNLNSVVLPSDVSKVTFGDDVFDGSTHIIEYVYRGASNPLSSTTKFGGLYDITTFARHINEDSHIKTEGRYVYYENNNVVYLAEMVAQEGDDEATITLPSTLNNKPYTIKSGFYSDYLYLLIINSSNITLSEKTFEGGSFGTVEVRNANVSANSIFEFASVEGELILGDFITSIGNSWFKDAYIESMYISGNITSIGTNAFSGDDLDIGEIRFKLAESQINPTINSGNDAYDGITKSYEENL